MRKSVKWFANEMERVLKQNDHKNGWNDCDNDWLFQRLNQEMFELFSELDRPIKKHDSLCIIKECCDIANFAMMIADNERENGNEK